MSKVVLAKISPYQNIRMQAFSFLKIHVGGNLKFFKSCLIEVEFQISPIGGELGNPTQSKESGILKISKCHLRSEI